MGERISDTSKSTIARSAVSMTVSRRTVLLAGAAGAAVLALGENLFLGAPAAIASSNGALATSELTVIAPVVAPYTSHPEVMSLTSGYVSLANQAAGAWNDMRNAATNSGIHLAVANPAGGYRSLAVQQSMKDHPADWAVDIPPSSLAGVGMSSHGLGLNVDVLGISNAAIRQWIDANASGFGFVHRDATNDPACMHFNSSYTSSNNFSTHGGQTVFTILYLPSVSWQFVVAPGMYVKNAPSGQASTLATAMGSNVYNVADLNTLNTLMWDSGFADQFGGPGQPADAWALLYPLGGGGTLYSTAYKKLMALP
jgi:hypothetical protein